MSKADDDEREDGVAPWQKGSAPADDEADGTGRSRVANAAEDEEDDDGEEDDEDGFDDEDGDEDDEDEDDEDAAPANPVNDGAAAATGLEAMLPDWAPWAVLLTLLAVGAVSFVSAMARSGEPAPAPSQTPAATASAPPRTSTSARPMLPPRAAMPAPDGERVRASHILIMHEGSTRKPPQITRTKPEAEKLAKELLAKVNAGGDFAALARESSDCPSAPRGGDLGMFRREQMTPAFSKAAFDLPVGKTSGIVETEFGYHIILRTQ